jgi:hypothetical protein
MRASGEHNMILFNSFNKFSIKPTLIQYPRVCVRVCDNTIKYVFLLLLCYCCYLLLFFKIIYIYIETTLVQSICLRFLYKKIPASKLYICLNYYILCSITYVLWITTDRQFNSFNQIKMLMCIVYCRQNRTEHKYHYSVYA